MTEILLAEDNPADVYLIRAALVEHGVDATTMVASDGQEVLRLIGSCGPDSGSSGPHPDLIILDLNLPRHDGLEILQQLRNTNAWAHVPVVVLTSSDSPRDRLMATQLGAVRFLRKPSSLDQFLGLGAVFKSLLESSGTTAAGRGTE